MSSDKREPRSNRAGCNATKKISYAKFTALAQRESKPEGKGRKQEEGEKTRTGTITKCWHQTNMVQSSYVMVTWCIVDGIGLIGERSGNNGTNKGLSWRIQ